MNDNEGLVKLIAENLIYYRKKAGLTQLQLAEQFNYSDKSISKWERGESIPDTFVLKALADYYGIRIDDFFRKEKVAMSVQIQGRKRIFTLLLSIGLVWLVSALAIILWSIFSEGFDYSWICVIYALVPSSILLVIWCSMYHKRLALLGSITLLIWTSALSLFLSLYLFASYPHAYLMFIVGIPLQILAILWYFLRRTIKEHKKTLA